MSLPVAILAGGLATRLRPLTEKIPKSLVEVAGKPFAIHQIELLRRYGLTQIVFCVGFLGEMVEKELGDGSTLGVELSYVFDGAQLLGTGGALRKAIPHLGESFFVLYGDSYLECDYSNIEQAFDRAGKRGLMTVLHNNNLWDRSNVIFQQGEIMAYDKKNPTSEMQHIDYGLGILSAAVLTKYPLDTPLDLASVYGDLIAQRQLAGYEVSQRFYEIGSIPGLEETRRFLSLRTIG